MPRGGKRKGSGAKSTWRHGKTKTIRVPIVLADKILELAKELDQNISCLNKEIVNKSDSIDSETQSKIINLSGISLISISGQMGVRLSDLINKGYMIKPEHINRIILLSMQKRS